ncbi:DUF6077 domain-containing protein [Bariatricus sp. SGI.019]|uniref:DUF6077 domain-containing protein n=1 Tax=Bariatricus sp. SGI.019 TaxID=3420548 RepID=UPI003D07CB60
MLEYFVCTLFMCAFILVLYAFGNILIKNDESQAVKFIVGYLVYSFFVAVGGIIIQLLNLAWIIFSIYLMIILVGMFLGIWKFKKKQGKIINCSIKEYIMNNWFLILVCVISCCMLLFYYRSFWYGNHLDDGYYITKVATLPYEKSGFRTNYAVGVEQGAAISYLLNTWELEASVFVKILGVTPTLFLRLFQSAFHYFVFFNCTLAFGEKIVKGTKQNYKTRELQYVLGVFLLFFIYYVYLMDSKLFFLRDMFHLNTGMYYGSSISKMIVIIVLLLFFIQEDKINLRMIMGVAGISVVLMSKSSIVLPVIIILIVASCFTWLFESSNKQLKWLAIGLLVVYILSGIFLPGNVDSQQEVYTYVESAMHSPIVWICIVIFIFSFTLKEKIVYRLNSIFILCGLLIVVPQVNDVFEICSVYDFVAGRACSTYIYTFVIISVFYSYMLIRKRFSEKRVRDIYIVITGIMTILLIYGYKTDGGELFVTDNMPANTNLIEDLKVIYHNNKFVPNSTIELGNYLETLGEEEGEKLLVLSPQWSGIDGTAHSLSTQLRTFAPSIISVSAIERYPVSADNELYGYDQAKYDDFVNDPSDSTLKKLNTEIEKYGINCIVVQNKECGEYLSKIGFEQKNIIQNGVYYVWYKDTY